MKIDRQKFLAIALGLAGCGGGQPASGGQEGSSGGEVEAVEVSSGGEVAPSAGCTEWDPSGECIAWVEDGPAEECVEWDPSGECIGWEPAYEA